MAESTTKGRDLIVVRPGSIGLPERALNELALVTDALQRAEKSGAHLLIGMTNIDFLPEDYRVSFRVVCFDTTFTPDQKEKRSNGTFYVVEGGGYALHRSALDRLAAAAGLTWVKDGCHRVDDGEVKFFWKWRMTGKYRDFDGDTREIAREKELDLTDDSPLLYKWVEGEGNRKGEIRRISEKQIRGMREHGAALCESKAANRVIRASLGLKGSYTKEDAARPFVLPKLVYNPDMNDPMIRTMRAASEFGMVDALFGPEGIGRMAIERSLPLPRYVQPADPSQPPADSAPEVDELESQLEDKQPEKDKVTPCSECKGPIFNVDVVDYSMRFYKRAVCLKCQDKLKATQGASRGGRS